ncbi:MAG: hypothetical protein VW837_05545, partial [Gammaproteobacteria bacterium]
MNMIKIVFYYSLTTFLLFSSTCYATDHTCEKIYKHCFKNVPKKIITFHQDLNQEGKINTNNINLRNLPIVNSGNSKIIKKLKKNSIVQVKQVFFIKPNTSIKIKLKNIEKYEVINNYRFGKWYLINYDGIDGFIFADFVTINIQNQTNQYLRYRHIDSVDWTKNKIKLQKNIELTLTLKNENSILLKGYAWHHLDGFFEIDTIFYKNILEKSYYQEKSNKLFLFDKNEIYLDFGVNI